MPVLTEKHRDDPLWRCVENNLECVKCNKAYSVCVGSLEDTRIIEKWERRRDAAGRKGLRGNRIRYGKCLDCCLVEFGKICENLKYYRRSAQEMAREVSEKRDYTGRDYFFAMHYDFGKGLTEMERYRHLRRMWEDLSYSEQSKCLLASDDYFCGDTKAKHKEYEGLAEIEEKIVLRSPVAKDISYRFIEDGTKTPLDLLPENF